MKLTAAIAPFLALVCFFSAGCAAEPSEESEGIGSSENAQSSASCGQGCDSLVASDGPFVASIDTYKDALGNTHRRLSVGYSEPLNSSFLLCRLFPRQPKATLVFVVGPEGARISVSRPMTASCPSSYGDNGGHPNHAFFSVTDEEAPDLWDTLFPPQAGGARWYALQVALNNAEGQWDSRYGHNYRLVFRSR
jgi:hypothetical protein